MPRFQSSNVFSLFSSTNTKKLRASGTSTLKDKGSIHNRSERLLQDSRDKRKTQICSSSSTGSESLSESDSDLSGSSSIRLVILFLYVFQVAVPFRVDFLLWLLEVDDKFPN